MSLVLFLLSALVAVDFILNVEHFWFVLEWHGLNSTIYFIYFVFRPPYKLSMFIFRTHPMCRNVLLIRAALLGSVWHDFIVFPFPALSHTKTLWLSVDCTLRPFSLLDTPWVTPSTSWTARRSARPPACSLVTWCSSQDVVGCAAINKGCIKS